MQPVPDDYVFVLEPADAVYMAELCQVYLDCAPEYRMAYGTFARVLLSWAEKHI